VSRTVGTWDCGTRAAKALVERTALVLVAISLALVVRIQEPVFLRLLAKPAGEAGRRSTWRCRVGLPPHAP